MQPVPINSTDSKAPEELRAVYRIYLGLARSMERDGLGGKLLFTGQADEAGCTLLRAANIAGAASLAASADAALLRNAMRGGAIDFVVNSLDEALRILKNEIRKQQPVAVGVSIAPEILLREMAERGVHPDLLPADVPSSPELQTFTARGTRTVAPLELQPPGNFHIVAIPEDWKQPAAAFDALLLECVAPDDAVNRRWVRLAPRYLPNAYRRLRSVVCDPDAFRQWRTRLAEAKLS